MRKYVCKMIYTKSLTCACVILKDETRTKDDHVHLLKTKQDYKHIFGTLIYTSFNLCMLWTEPQLKMTTYIYGKLNKTLGDQVYFRNFEIFTRINIAPQKSIGVPGPTLLLSLVLPLIVTYFMHAEISKQIVFSIPLGSSTFIFRKANTNTILWSAFPVTYLSDVFHKIST